MYPIHLAQSMLIDSILANNAEFLANNAEFLKTVLLFVSMVQNFLTINELYCAELTYRHSALWRKKPRYRGIPSRGVCLRKKLCFKCASPSHEHSICTLKSLHTKIKNMSKNQSTQTSDSNRSSSSVNLYDEIKGYNHSTNSDIDMQIKTATPSVHLSSHCDVTKIKTCNRIRPVVIQSDEYHELCEWYHVNYHKLNPRVKSVNCRQNHDRGKQI